MAYSDGVLETKSTALSPSIEECGLAQAAILLGDKWTLLILREALYGVTRFDDIHAELGLPRSVLSKRLKLLVEQGVLKRRPYKASGQRARDHYVLTQRGVELALPMAAIMQWGDKHLRSGAVTATIRERKSGDPLTVALTRPGDDDLTMRHAWLDVD